MKRSEDRILTTHTGSLPRPPELIALYRGESDADLGAGLREAVAGVVRRQTDLGIDVVNDGEFGKPVTGEVDYGAFMRYRHDRVSGYELVEVEEDAFMVGKDREDYAEFYATGEALMNPTGRQTMGVCVGPIAYVGHDLLRRDIENLQAGLAGVGATGAFMSAISPDTPRIAPDGHYASAEEAAVALAEALREEYRLITDAGLMLQIDDARMVATYETAYSSSADMPSFRAWAQRRVELLNHALDGIPPEQVRYHLCWGSWKGPHSSDLPLADVVDLLLQINASQYVVEAANPQHEHEWELWESVELPDGKALVPGVVTHKTNVVEHPRVVAQRILRYAEAVGRERVIAGTDCGMGGRIHPQLAWGKLRALVEGAELATKQLWAPRARA